MIMWDGILYLLKEIKVGNVIIGNQFESSENYKKFLKIINDKKINISVVNAGTKINIENNLYFDVLWPDVSNPVSENSINNNALVCKLNYKDFSCIFTGDIEEPAEEILVSRYKNSDILRSTILKVGHHGSNSSSIQEFVELVNPDVALIGVGKNNNFRTSK